MKCPHCGHWNRDSFPRCFYCGTPLTPSPENQEKSWQKTMREEKPQKIYIRVDDAGNATSATDERDVLAREMNKLQERKERGKVRQRDLMEEGARQGLAPSGRTVEKMTSRESLYSRAQNTTYIQDDAPEIEGQIRPDATQVKSSHPRQQPEFIGEDYVDDWQYHQQPRSRRSNRTLPVKQVRVTRSFGRRRFIKIAAVLLIVCALLSAGYYFVYYPFFLKNQTPPLQELVEISPSIYEDKPAHTIKIPGEEGAVIYIKELRKSYTVTGGYAMIEVPDFNWYENMNVISESEITATLTPYLKTSAGEQVPMEQIHFQVEVPLSPLQLVSPDTGYAEVSTAIYNIKFRVERNSSVYINGEDFSDLVNTQDGLISYNASILPIGNNVFTITTKCQYYRENSATVTIYRAEQDIPLDLSTTLSNRSLNQTMRITATTLPGADISIESDYVNLDTSTLNSTGVFSFEAVFTRIGTNTITITASYPGKETSVVHYDVYYLPESKVYTAKAWPLYKAWEYSDLLSHVSARVNNAQIYLCLGEITEIISDSPQLAIMEMGTEDSSRKVMLENRSTDVWEVGKRYRIYADMYGLYNSLPRLVGRYTYPPLD